MGWVYKGHLGCVLDVTAVCEEGRVSPKLAEIIGDQEGLELHQNKGMEPGVRLSIGGSMQLKFSPNDPFIFFGHNIFNFMVYPILWN